EGSGPGLLSGADQQGLHQILRDFCQRAGPLCGDCRFPDWIGQRAGESAGVPSEAPSPKTRIDKA
ncbi:MAG: hypothetical protein KIT22_01445, partial [Verrucomicrobiae bacterium]|nr:hypothetical protein [Verrucomicrobiae bacterium]